MNIFSSSLWRRQTEIQELVFDHLSLVEETLEKYKRGIFVWLEEGDLEKANELAFETHKLEGEADDLRREIEKELLGGALLARSRSEMLNIIERTDKLANAGEATMDFALLQEIRVPDNLTSYAKEVVEVSLDIVSEVESALHSLFQEENSTLEHTSAIEKKEGEIDDIERNFIRELFEMDLPLAEKILLRQFMENLVELSDRAEDLSDEIEILVATRKT